MIKEITTISAEGSIVLPQKIRTEFKWKKGQKLLVSIEEGNIVLRTEPKGRKTVRKDT